VATGACQSDLHRELLPGQALVRPIGDAQDVLTLKVDAELLVRPMGADLGVVSQGVRISQDGLPDGLSLAQQPATEVVEAVIGTG
jgi:hypothetical protein